jgi:hypothetical protein
MFMPEVAAGRVRSRGSKEQQYRQWTEVAVVAGNERDEAGEDDGWGYVWHESLTFNLSCVYHRRR